MNYDEEDDYGKGKNANIITPREEGETPHINIVALINVQKYIRRFLATKRFMSQEFNIENNVIQIKINFTNKNK